MDELIEELRQLSTDPNDVDDLVVISDSHYPSVTAELGRIVCRIRTEVPDQSLRLVDGTSNSGRLEVSIDGEWVTVCSVGWRQENTEVACKQMGFPGGLYMYTMNQTSYHRRIGVTNIHCRGNESKLLHCYHYPPFYRPEPNCDHRSDVFLHCLCADCGDYKPGDYIRLEDGTSVSGRLEVFSPEHRMGGVCRNGWTASNTRVACRQMGFLDGAGTYRSQYSQPMTYVLYQVSCSGDERALFDCNYTATFTHGCTEPIHIRCVCKYCQEFFLESPHQVEATTSSAATFQWRLKQNVTRYKFHFLSQKNPQTLMRVDSEVVLKEPTRFEDRIESTDRAVGFKLTNVTSADMGMYCLDVPPRFLDCKAMLAVTDFAVGPEPVINRKVRNQLCYKLSVASCLRHLITL